MVTTYWEIGEQIFKACGENDEYKNRKKHIYKEDWADSIYCPLSFQRRGKGNHAGKD